MLRAVRLYGRLGTRFGKEHRLDVASTAEAVRALAYQLPGFADYIRHRNYVVTVGDGGLIGQEQLDLRFSPDRAIHIHPAGAVSGIETILLGATLLFTAIASIAVLSMPKVPTASSREEATRTASFIFDGAQNTTEQGHVVPLIYGRFRTGSVVGSAGIATTDANAASVSLDPTNPVYGGIGDGGASYGGYVGSSPGFKDSEFGEWTLAKGGKGAAGTARSAQEDPNTLQSQATAKILDIIGEGEIVGLVDGLKSIYFDETPLQNPDGSFNFSGVAVEQRFGLPDQDFIPGFTDTENTDAVDTKVSVLVGPITRTISDASATVARVTIRLPQLYQQDTTNGDLKATSVAVKISVQADGLGFTDVTTMTFDGKTNSAYQRSVDVRLPAGTTRQIRVTRLTADSAVASLSNETRFDLLTSIVEAKLSYPDTAMVGLTVDARQFGSNIPTRSYDVKGLIIEVPTNYDPVTRVYTGVWDGTFKRAWCDNPAWVLRDVIVHRRYGLGTRIGATLPDKWTLYAIAQHNDGLVPDGFGGTQPRYTINVAITNAAQAYDLIASIASNFRGFVHWGSGSIITSQDRPEDPSILLTPSNTVEGKISYGRVTPIERRRSVAVVYWNDPSDGYKLTPEPYEDPDLIRRFGRRTGDEVTGFGITNQGQAYRAARWILEDEKPASNTSAAYEVGDDHSFVEPGRVAAIADPMFVQSRRGGRVVSATANSVTIDDPYIFVGGQTYKLRVMLPDGSNVLRTVTNSAGAATVITLSGSAFTTNPNPGAVWTLETDTVANRQFRIRAITTDEAPYAVRAVSHDPTKYARVEQNVSIESPNFLDLPSGPLLPPGDITAQEFLLPDGTASIPSVQVSWVASGDPRVTFYQSQYKRPGGGWEPLADSLDLTRVVRGTEVGSWMFRARSLDSLGRKTAWVETTVALDGQVDDLPEVQDLSLTVSADAGVAALVWDAPVDPRPLRYEILYNSTNSLGGAVSIGVQDTQTYVVTESGYYWVRTRFIDSFSVSPPGLTVAASVLPGRLFTDQLEATTLDSTLSPKEKSAAMIDYAALDAQHIALNSRYSTLGSPADLTAYVNAANTSAAALLTYLGTISPAWNVPTSGPSTIVGSTYRSKWTQARNDLEALATAITGRSPISGFLTNEAHGIPAASDGTASSYTGAGGSFRVFDGTADVSSSFALSTASGGNPQGLTVNYSAQTYTVSGGFDAGEDAATLTIRATGSGAYAGITVDKVFSLSKQKAGVAGEQGEAGNDGEPGDDGEPGPQGAPAFLYRQPGTPTGTIQTGAGWYKTDTKEWFSWNGSSWVKMGGALASYDAVEAGFIAANAVTATEIDISGGTGTGTRIEIDTNLIRFFDPANTLRLQIGDWT